MAIVNETIEAGGATPPATIPVWDRFVRFFHWSLVLLFILAYATGDEVERIHVAAGYGIAALLALRIVWGFIGPQHARFGSFVKSPREVVAFMRDMSRFRARRYIGHNPAGAAMVLALLLALAATVVTGVMMTTDAFWGAQWVEDLHGILANVTVGLVLLHVAGVLFASFEHGENLVAAMVTGRKRAE
jgi:cytochrome b